jgi:hypothetical protein
LQNRPPLPIDVYPLGSVPNWLKPFIWFFVCFSARYEQCRRAQSA